MHSVSDKFDFILYADDTTLIGNFSKFKSDQVQNGQLTVAENVNLELVKISDWVAVNKLSLNTKKCNFMIFHHKQKNMQLHNLFEIEINNTKIERVSNFNFLGLTLNEHIDWSDHIAKIANKISRTIGILKKLKNILPSSILFIMYNSLILPQLHYCLKER